MTGKKFTDILGNQLHDKLSVSNKEEIDLLKEQKADKTEVQEKIDDIHADLDSISEEVTDLITTKADKSEIYPKSHIDSIASDVAHNSNQIEVLAETIVDDKSELQTAIGNVAEDVSLLDEKVNVNIENIANLNNNLDALTGDVENIAGELDNKADKSEIPTIPTDISYFNNDAGYINHVKTLNNQSLVGTGNISIDVTKSFDEIQGNPYSNTNLKNALDNKVGFTDYAINDKAGVIKVDNSNGLFITSGHLKGYTVTKDVYNTRKDGFIIDKGTLENIKEDYITSIGDIKYQSIGDYATNTALTQGLATKQNAISDLATIRDGASKGATALQNTNDCVHLTSSETITGQKTFKLNNSFGNNTLDAIFANGIFIGDGMATTTSRLFNTRWCNNSFQIKTSQDIGYSYLAGSTSTNYGLKYQVQRMPSRSSYPTSAGVVEAGMVLSYDGLIVGYSEQANKKVNDNEFIYVLDQKSVKTKTIDTLATTDKTIIGAINELIPTITKSNNNNGIIKYPDGRMEQWGLATSSNIGETEFTMNNSFVDTNFQVFIEPRQAGDLVHYAIPSATNKFKARIQNTSGAYMTCQFQWRAYGFWK